MHDTKKVGYINSMVPARSIKTILWNFADVLPTTPPTIGSTVASNDGACSRMILTRVILIACLYSLIVKAV